MLLSFSLSLSSDAHGFASESMLVIAVKIMSVSLDSFTTWWSKVSGTFNLEDKGFCSDHSFKDGELHGLLQQLHNYLSIITGAFS